MQVYLLRFKDGSLYIGCHKISIDERFSEHRKRALRDGSCALVHQAWRAQGEPELELIAEASSVEEMHLLEMAWISELGTVHPGGLNISVGGPYNASAHAVARESFARAKKGTKRSAETRAKMSASQKGHSVSEETRAKISAVKKKKFLEKAGLPLPRTMKL